MKMILPTRRRPRKISQHNPKEIKHVCCVLQCSLVIHGYSWSFMVILITIYCNMSFFGWGRGLMISIVPKINVPSAARFSASNEEVIGGSHCCEFRQQVALAIILPTVLGSWRMGRSRESAPKCELILELWNIALTLATIQGEHISKTGRRRRRRRHHHHHHQPC